MKEILEYPSEPISVLRECHRILKPSERVYIRVVYCNYKSSFSDPTHKHAFTEITFKFFTEEWRPYYMDFHFKDLFIDYIFAPNAIRKFGNNRKRLLKEAYFYCNIIDGMNIIMTK